MCKVLYTYGPYSWRSKWWRREIIYELASDVGSRVEVKLKAI